MKYSYKTEIVANQHHNVLVLRLPEEILLVELFLFTEITGRGEWGEDFFAGAIDKVLSGEAESQEVGGNVYALEIRKDFTRVIDTLAEDDLCDSCVIETSELRKLIRIWLDELEKFNQDQKA